MDKLRAFRDYNKFLRLSAFAFIVEKSFSHALGNSFSHEKNVSHTLGSIPMAERNTSEYVSDLEKIKIQHRQRIHKELMEVWEEFMFASKKKKDKKQKSGINFFCLKAN